MFLLVAAASVFAFVVYLVFRYKQLNSHGCSGPPSYPLLGGTLTLGKHLDDYLEWIPTTRETYGEVWGFNNLFNDKRIIITFVPEDVEYFLVKNFKNYERRSNVTRFWELFGRTGGIFTSNGDTWKSIRNTAKPHFRGKALRPMLAVFLDRAKALCQVLEDAMASGEPKDIHDLMYRYTLDSIGEIGFGINIDSLNTPVPFAQAFDEAQEIVEANARQQWRNYLPDRRFDEAMDVMNTFVAEIIDTRRKESESELASKDDLLSQYLLKRDEDGNPFSATYLRDMLINFFIAGRDTTATLLSWTLYMVAEHPEVEAKLTQELHDVLGGADPTAEQLPELKYMKAVLDETLRLFPPVPQDGRSAVADDVLPSGYPVHQGDIVVYCPWVMHRHPDFWDHPEDFDPDRWLEGNPLKHKHQYAPFHAGAQLCLGQKMAFIEAQAALSLVLQRYRLRRLPACRVVPRKAIVLKMAEGLMCTVHPAATRT